MSIIAAKGIRSWRGGGWDFLLTMCLLPKIGSWECVTSQIVKMTGAIRRQSGFRNFKILKLKLRLSSLLLNPFNINKILTACMPLTCRGVRKTRYWPHVSDQELLDGQDI